MVVHIKIYLVLSRPISIDHDTQFSLCLLAYNNGNFAFVLQFSQSKKVLPIFSCVARIQQYKYYKFT